MAGTRVWAGGSLIKRKLRAFAIARASTKDQEVTMASATAHPNHQLISSEDVEGTNVYDMKGTKIGEIDHLMIDKVSGRVTYAVMSFGGFIGLGHSHYPLPWAALKYDTKLGGYVTGVTEKQLQDAPAFSDDSWSNRNWEAQTYKHYNVPPYWA